MLVPKNEDAYARESPSKLVPNNEDTYAKSCQVRIMVNLSFAELMQYIESKQSSLSQLMGSHIPSHCKKQNLPLFNSTSDNYR